MTDTATLWTITHAQKSLVDLDSFSEEMVPVMPGTLCCEVPATRRLSNKGTAFRIFDDDGNLYYRGRYHGDPAALGAFAPLDWAQGEAGATRIDYFEDGKWATL